MILSPYVKKSKGVRKVVNRYTDAVRIAGGLVLADDLREVSRVLREEFEAGSAYYTFNTKVGDLTLKRDTLAAKEDMTAADQRELDRLNQQIAALTAQLEPIKIAVDEKRAALEALRNRVSVKKVSQKSMPNRMRELTWPSLPLKRCASCAGSFRLFSRTPILPSTLASLLAK